MSLIKTIKQRGYYFFSIVLLGLFSLTVNAEGGISIQGTRIIYPLDARQVTVTMNNLSKTDTFLVQSWIESANGEKSKDFIVTPPLYVSKPQDGNSLRLMFTGKGLPQDRETVYYFVGKAIPSVDRQATEGKNALILAAANRIKLFVRPAGLKPEVGKAPELLSFHRQGKHLEINNPTPYYLTLTEIKAGNIRLQSVMVAPKGKATLSLPAGSGNSIAFKTIDDFGAMTPLLTKTIS